MLSLILLFLAASQCLAFPDLLQERHPVLIGCRTLTLCDRYIPVTDAQAAIPLKPNAAMRRSQSRTNCGALGVCKTFNATQQYVSTEGIHAFRAPTKNDIRGPCPGLNAAANHNYVPRNGLLNITQASNGLYAAYGLQPQLGAFLAAYAIVVSGDIYSLTWSIGGPIPIQDLSGGINYDPQGISYSHSLYEGDASPTRCDAYINDGDAHAASVTRFKYAYESGISDNRYTLDDFSRLYAMNTIRSIGTNAYYFVPFVTTTFTPTWYNFAINFFSNHSATETAGYLDGEILQDFFAMNGTYPNFHWNKGKERIPNNWYRRPDENLYGTANLFEDLLAEFPAYPDTFRFGGNVNGDNTYVGINISNITEGAYNDKTIFQGDNLACFFLLNIQQTVAQVANDNDVNNGPSPVALFDRYTPSYFRNLKCPTIKNYNLGVYKDYTGDGYEPEGPPPYEDRRNC